MKKYLILGIALGIILALNAWAATTTISGKVTDIQKFTTTNTPYIGSFSIIKNLNWLQKLTGAIFNRAIETPITLQVIEGTKFYLRTSATTGFTEGSFQDLKVNDQVNVLTDVRTAYGTLPSNNYTVYTALEVKITGRFIPVPKTIPAITQCQTDTDCTWCGMNCVLKTTLKDRMCAQVMPKEGTECKCVFVLPPAGITPTTVTGPSGNAVPLPTYGVCKAVLSTSTPSTTLVPSNQEQILQEMTRIKNQIKTLEQRLKELEKLLNAKSSTL